MVARRSAPEESTTAVPAVALSFHHAFGLPRRGPRPLTRGTPCRVVVRTDTGCVAGVVGVVLRGHLVVVVVGVGRPAGDPVGSTTSLVTRLAASTCTWTRSCRCCRPADLVGRVVLGRLRLIGLRPSRFFLPHRPGGCCRCTCTLDVTHRVGVDARPPAGLYARDSVTRFVGVAGLSGSPPFHPINVVVSMCPLASYT